MASIGLMPYDCSVKSNGVAFKALPGFYQNQVKVFQSQIYQMLLQNNPGREAEIIRTSGFRSMENSTQTSLHPFGLATDLRRVVGQTPFKVAPGFIIIESGVPGALCWHVAFKRGL